jgi:hypothetical protein
LNLARKRAACQAKKASRYEEGFRPVLQITITKGNLPSCPKSVSQRLQERRINERIIGNTIALSPGRKEEMHRGFHNQI